MPLQASHSPWVLQHVIEIDRAVAGLCGEFFRASNERRQVISAYLAAKPPTEASMLEVGRLLLDADHRSILADAYGEVPRGFRGALRRSGPAVHKVGFYTLLNGLLAAPTGKHVQRCVSHLGSLDLHKLLVIQLLPQSLCHPSVVEAILNTREAGDVATAFRLLVERGLDEELLAASIRQVDTGRGLSEVFRKAARRARAPEHPIPPFAGYTPIRSGEELYRTGREFRNCLRGYMTRFLDEQDGHAFAVAIRDGARAVVHLAQRESEWRLEGIFGPRNSRPPSRMREWVIDHLIERGVKVEIAHQRKASDWDSVRRIISEDTLAFDFDLGLDD